ncbi:MAG: glycosyltransferase family 2 protein [Candidatus Korobacteraceae bacterium]
MPSLVDLTRLDAAALASLPPGEEPHLAVIVPACNEEESIEATLRSLLGSVGIRLEIIAVNDRSTDRTGALMEEVARLAVEGSHRLRVIHLKELPAGWLGKPHAMAKAAQQTTAPWLLFTDADVVFAPNALALALRHAIADRADHLCLALTLDFRSVGEAAVLATMTVLAQRTIRFWKIADPRARDYFGTGAFNLIRRAVYSQLGGFEALRMEVVEDLCLGWKVKHAGFAQRLVLGPGLVNIRWIQGAFGVVHLAEKNAFAVYRYHVWLLLLGCLGLAATIVFPFAALAASGWTPLAGILLYVSIALGYVACRRFTQVSPWLAIFFAPAAAIVLFASLRSMVLTLHRNGVEWRGVRYPLDELRKNAGRLW